MSNLDLTLKILNLSFYQFFERLKSKKPCLSIVSKPFNPDMKMSLHDMTYLTCLIIGCIGLTQTQST